MVINRLRLLLRPRPSLPRGALRFRWVRGVRRGGVGGGGGCKSVIT